MCLLYFQRVTLLILFCYQFSNEILQVHNSVFQCCCSSKNIQDLVCDMNTFQAQLQRLLFTTCTLDNISSAAYSLSFNWLACQPPSVASKLLPIQVYTCSRTQYKWTDQWRKYKVMLTCLCFSTISKYYSQTVDLKRARDYTKLFPVCEVEMIQVMVNKIEVLSSF